MSDIMDPSSIEKLKMTFPVSYEILKEYGVAECYTTQELLNVLNGTVGLSWRRIALLQDFVPIPFSVLNSFATGRREPQNLQYRRILNLPIKVEVDGEICAYRNCDELFFKKNKRHKYHSSQCGGKERRLLRNEKKKSTANRRDRRTAVAQRNPDPTPV